MKNNFKKNGCMRVRYETAEERREILRILEEQRGFRIDDEQKKVTKIHSMSSCTFDINLKFKTIQYGIRPFIGAAMMSSGVRFYSAREFFRIAELGFKVVPRFPVFHVPHDGRQFPPELMESVCIPEADFLRYHETMRDTDIFRVIPEAYRGGDMSEIFPISRMMCDPERFIGQEEIMERYGMGFCYERAYDGTVIKRVTDEVREKTLRYYWKHHARMDRICDRHPRILLVDLHSYSDEIVPKDFLKEDRPTPDVCIGADDRFTPPELTEIVKGRYSEAGFTTGVNYPYSGCYIPNTVWKGKSSCDCIGIMLEHHKRIYCDEQGRSAPEKLAKIRDIIRQILADFTELG